MAFEDDIRSFRTSTSLLGAGFIEAIANETLLSLRRRQPSALRGSAVIVPVLEAGGRAGVGRFGWKSHHASLVSRTPPSHSSTRSSAASLLDFLPARR